MQRTLRMLQASVYSFCVLRVGGRLGRLCGSERAGRLCALSLLFVAAFFLFIFTLVELSTIIRGVFSILHGTSGATTGTSGNASSLVDLWGRDVTTDLHFEPATMAYTELSEKEKAAQRTVYAAIEQQKQVLAKANEATYKSRIFGGTRDPNAFRANLQQSGSLPRPVEAVVDGLSIIRTPGSPALPFLQTFWRTYTPLELYERYDGLDIIYSFVNGTEPNHIYRKNFRLRCGQRIFGLEEKYFKDRTMQEQADVAAGDAQDGEMAAGPGEENDNNTIKKKEDTRPSVLDDLEGPCPYFAKMRQHRNDQLLELFDNSGNAKVVDDRDRETDELRHSLRSVEQHIQWHRGRVVMVSPGHHPTWVDGAKNFLAGTCGGAAVQALRTRGTHLRLTTVHQDAIMPYGMRLTADSHTIEQHIWRVKNTSAVHVYMNDDYFVNRDVAITDLLNEYGGTIVRTESLIMPQGAKASPSVSWAEGVAHVELFLIQHLELMQEDFLPSPLARYWQSLLHADAKASTWHRLLERVREKAERLTGARTPTEDEAEAEREVQNVLQFRELLLAANNSFYWESAVEPPAQVPPLPDGAHRGRLTRFYATHAPFPYCTNMFRHFSVRFKETLAPLQLYHRERMARDLFAPFLYNGYIMARPWEASAQFLPFLLQLRDAKTKAAAATKANLHRLPGVTAPYFQEKLNEEFYKHLAVNMVNVSIYLDNEDGCAPATLYRNPAASVMYMRATDDVQQNEKSIDQIRRGSPLYFNINAGFSNVAVADQLRKFLHDKFPTPMFMEAAEELETTAAAAAGVKGTAIPSSDAALTKIFQELMGLPVVGVVSYGEGVCPLVRSLPLAFASHHRGRVHVAVQRYSDSADGDETLRAARDRLRHRILSAMPATSCTFDRRVSTGISAKGESVADIARRVIGLLDAGVTLPSTCGGAVDGLRVRGFVVDARTPNAPVTTAAALREALAMPGQTLALEDFRAVRVGPEERDVVLVLSREDAEAKAVHWITGASENDLLLTYPLPVRAYEDMNAKVRWSEA